VKILHVYKGYPPVVGGMENHVRLLAERQARRGLDVTVLSASARGRGSLRDENGVRVIRTRPWVTLASAPLSPGMALWMRRLTPDVTHLHFPYPPGEIAHRLLGRGRATIVSYQSDIVRQRWLGRLYGPLMRRVLADADRVLVSSAAYLESSPHLQRIAAKCSVVPLGIEPAAFRVPDNGRSAGIRRREGAPLVLFVGKLRYYKGVDVLIEAAERIDACILIAGTGPMEARLRRQASASRAARRIRFLGEVADEDLPYYYAAADLVVLPSSHRSEAFGIVLLEAMAAGRPVVSTELGTGTSFVNQHGVTGLVVAGRDPAGLAGAVNRLLADPAERRRMGDNGRRRVDEVFPIEKMVDRMLAIYREALGGRGAAGGSGSGSGESGAGEPEGRGGPTRRRGLG
jgi:rhamnosyl/mannosyltransferase